ncbi:hypothetical protein MMC27_007458 [Xylographa pallens]|nr:hypothetical protein [Xylographa pallens]
MRLLHRKNDGNISLTDDIIQDIPAYAILSHTWARDDEEVTFKDIQDDPGQAKSKAGYRKIEFCGKQAASDKLEYFWVDTCCINKSNNTELAEAINSMFRWYRNAAKCYVYLADVSISSQDDIDQALQKSRWFTRGWTLQELIAPGSVEFFSSDDKRLGDKKLLEQQLFNITGVALAALRGDPLDSFSVEQRMAWAEKRTTKKEEDIAYSLLGIFNVFMPPIYGEGTKHAFYRLNEEIKKHAKASADRNLSEGLPMLRSDSIFLQERLLVRADIQSFLTEALSCNGNVRVILHGLPGIGKSTMARSFAYNAQKTITILWIPGNSEAAIKQAFEQYARQICGNNQQYSEPMPLIARQLSESFSGQWLIVFDGLDAPLINIQQYLFADLGESKILITTRNKDLASYIKATHVLQVNPLNEKIGQDLLNVYINTGSASLTVGQAVQEEQTPTETDARRRIVKELGGLPLAIAIVGAALRKESGIPSINSQTYLTWADEVKDILLEQDPVFSDYSSSVWKSFQFAFQGILQGTGINQYAAFMAHFVASCENASNLAEYIRLYRTASTRSAATPCRPVIGQLRFLETGFFELAIKALAAVNMVTVNWMEGGPNDVPYIEMHSLVRRWLGSTNHDKVFTYAGSKMWLLGFGMYDQMNGSGVGTSRFEPLLKELSEMLIESPRMLDGSQVPASEAVFPLLLDAQMKLSKSTEFLPAGSAQRSRLHQFSRGLESEITNSYDDNLKDIDWNSVFQDWAQELGEQVEYAVGSDAERADYMLKDFFLDTLDSHGCIPIAFGTEAPYELHYVGQTDTIEEIKIDITARTESLLVKHLDQEAFRQLPAIAPNESSAFIRTWSKRWEMDVTEIIRNCLAKVFVKLQSAADTQRLATELPLPSNTAAVVGDQNFGSYLQSMTSSSDPRNTFFAVLRRTVKAATEQFLDSCPAVEILNEQKDTFRDICERAIRKGFSDGAADAFHSQTLSAEVGTDTVFSMLWELAWPGRFPGDLDNLIAAETFKAISDDLKNAAKQGFSSTFENHLYNSSSFVEKLAYEVFSASTICNIFPNWILSGWIDPLSDDEDSGDKEPTYINLMHESKQQIMSAMKSIYDDRASVADEGTAVQALKSTFDCRKVIHDEVMDKLNQPELTDRTGMGPFFAKMHFEDCDQSLRLACSVLQHGASEDFVGSLDHLIHVENAWNFSKAR